MASENDSNVAENLRVLMAARGLKAPELARKAKVNRTGVYDILSGRSAHPRIDTLEKLAGALGVSTQTLQLGQGVEDVIREIADTAARLPLSEQRRLLLTAQAWLSDSSEPDKDT